LSPDKKEPYTTLIVQKP